jgi:dihydroorotate dehydrogenase (NAD+) catalytic subunit
MEITDRAAVDLTVPLGPLTLANPILVASGTYGYGVEFQPFADVSRLGAVIGKTITLEPRAGNPPPRTVETPAGMLNSIGLQNPGIDRYLQEKLPFLLSLGSPVITSIAGIRAAEFTELARRIEAHGQGIDALELNLSCPNIEAGGWSHGCDPGITADIVSSVRAASSLPLIAKLTPNVTDVTVVARAAADAGADALSLINTLVGMAVDWRRRCPRLARKTGGLSGPAIKPVALWQVHATSQAVDIPVIGIGGISCLDDVMEFLVAGASAVQIGTANYVDPTLAVRLVDELAACLAAEGVDCVAEVVGTLRDAPPPEGH